MKKKATITVETERFLVICGSKPAVNHWCEDCGAEALMVGLDEAAAVAGLSHRAIFHLTDIREIHFVETAGGKALFCVASLLKQTHARTTRLLIEERKD
jgi:hypothetical protein